MIDTIGYDKGIQLQEYYEFFNVSLPLTKDISKIKSVSDKIKYNFKQNRENSSSADCIMAYLFVFDYNERKTLKDILTLAKEIKFQEKIRLANKSHGTKSERSHKTKSPIETIKIFVANKCPFLVEDDAPIQTRKKEIIYPIYKYDETAAFYLNEIMPMYDNNREDTMENLFFVNAKNNIGVGKVFSYMAKEVIQKEDLWKILKYEENKLDPNKHNSLIEDETQVSCFEMLFMCKCAKKTTEDQVTNEKEDNTSDSAEEIVPEVLNESEEINEILVPDYNSNSTKNQNIDQMINVVQPEEKKDDDGGKKGIGCIIM